MEKNKLEKKFSQDLKADSKLWGMKLHNNPLSHQNTPGDYLVTRLGCVILMECKQVTCDENGMGRLAHKRLKQMHDMLSFENKFPGFHKAYFVVAFYNGVLAKSDVYIIPVKVMYEEVTNHSMVSFNRIDMLSIFKEYRCASGVLPIWAMTF